MTSPAGPPTSSVNEAGPDLPDLMTRLHDHLRRTLGAAVGLAFLERAVGRLRFVGVGNTLLRVVGATEARLVSHDGTVGQRMRTPREQSLTLRSGDLVLLTTDGIKSRFGPEQYPGLLGDSPEHVAQTVVRLFGREHDDASCIAVRYRP